MAVNWVRFPSGAADRTTAPVPLWPLETVLDAVAGAGFPSIGLDHYSLARFAGGPDELATALAERGLGCSDIGILTVGALELADVERLASTAAAVGARLCIAALYRPMPHEQIVRDLRAAAEVLSPAGIRTAFEFTVYGHPTSLADAVRICDDVGWDDCGLLVDAWHVFRGGVSLDEVAALDGGRIALVHVDDGGLEPSADAMAEGRFHRLLPGSGSFDLMGFRDALDAAGYEGPISLEVLSEELRQLAPPDAARRLRRSMGSYF